VSRGGETGVASMHKLISTDFNFHEALKDIDAHPKQRALRARNEARLAALKAANQLTEPRAEPEPPVIEVNHEGE
jgi:hypothetical protein